VTGITRAGTRIVGSLRSEGGKGTVRVQDRYDTDIDDLWSALTDPRRLARWIAEVKGDLRPGGVFHARFTSNWECLGQVEACDPPRRLLLTMSPGQPHHRAPGTGGPRLLPQAVRGLRRGTGPDPAYRCPSGPGPSRPAGNRRHPHGPRHHPAHDRGDRTPRRAPGPRARARRRAHRTRPAVTTDGSPPRQDCRCHADPT
jgi:hypothetical protein